MIKSTESRNLHRRSRLVGVAGFTAAIVSVGLLAAAPMRTAESERIAASIEVLEALTQAPDDAIPEYILERAEAIVVIPTLVKGGLIIGAEHGRGVMSIRNRAVGEWSAPTFVVMTGGSVGWQIGLESTDLVLVVTNPEGVDDLLKSEFTLGASASVAVGPVGRSAEASTDARMGAKILAYSRAKGLFAGATIEGSALKSDDDANRRFYGPDAPAADGLAAASSRLAMPLAGAEWRAALERLVGPAA